MAPFATPPHSTGDDPSAAGDQARLHRWETRGRPAVPLLTDAVGRVNVITHHVAAARRRDGAVSRGGAALARPARDLRSREP
jgi:hypothetical protein